MELKDTVQLMQSDDYKDRFRAEYQQLAIRYKKLKKMVDDWDNLNFIPICPKSTYNMQLRAMRAWRPSGVPAAISLRRSSPVERWQRLYFCTMALAWVPLPAPGGPKRM